MVPRRPACEERNRWTISQPPGLPTIGAAGSLATQAGQQLSSPPRGGSRNPCAAECAGVACHQPRGGSSPRVAEGSAPAPACPREHDDARREHRAKVAASASGCVACDHMSDGTTLFRGVSARAPDPVRRSMQASQPRGSPAGPAIRLLPTSDCVSTRRAEGALLPRRAPGWRHKRRPSFAR